MSLVDYFLNSSSEIVYLETLQFSHPDFSQVYYLVRNSVGGLTATLENSVEVNFQYYPLRIKPLGSSGDLNQSLSITLGDLGELIPKELEAVATKNGFQTKPSIVYRCYRSDDLSSPLFGPIFLEVTSFSFDKESSSFGARAPSVNVNKTGELYTLTRFPMLRAFI